MKLAAISPIMFQLPGLCGAQLQAGPIIQKIAPGSASCDAAATECRTATQAAPFIVQGMADYKMFSVNEIAAVLSLMAFESVDFKYKHNVYPGRPGQGTANMQMAKYNLMYAKSLDDVKDKVSDVNSVDGLSDDRLNEILALVTPDEHNFGSGPWFLATQCGQDVRDALKRDIDSGFDSYMGCVGVTVTDERRAYLTRAKAAFGL